MTMMFGLIRFTMNGTTSMFKTTDEMLQEINKGIDEQINISRDIREHLMVMDVRSEKYEDVPYKILGRLYEIIFRRNYQRGIFSFC